MDMILKKVKIFKILELTHDTKGFVIERPQGFSFSSGQSMFVAIDKDDWRDKAREFTICSKPSDDYLELIIKIYRDRPGVTRAMDDLVAGDSLLISKAFGNLDYRPEKYSNHVFIGAGSSLTKFLSLLRSLNDNDLSKVVLIYSNKTKSDIILEDELKKMFSKYHKNLVLTLTREELAGYHYGRVNKELLSKYVNKDSKVVAIGPGDFSSEIMVLAREIKSM